MLASKMLKLAAGGLVLAAATLSVHDARSASPSAPRQVTPTGTGFAGVYGSLPADQVEFLSTPDTIKSAAVSGAPTLVWEALEHGEKVECLDCIASVAPLLYDANAKTREIAAWWLRRRVFGVFGDGEVYSQTIQTLQTSSSPVRRAVRGLRAGRVLRDSRHRSLRAGPDDRRRRGRARRCGERARALERRRRRGACDGPRRLEPHGGAGRAGVDRRGSTPSRASRASPR